jgi:RNA polymerase sigma factor (sigma-70 family)
LVKLFALTAEYRYFQRFNQRTVVLFYSINNPRSPQEWQVNVLVFDQRMPDKAFWQNLCDAHNVQMRSFDALPEHVMEPQPTSRVLIFDQSVVGCTLSQAEELCRKGSQDVLVFTGESLSVSHTVQLMKMGAGWVFTKEFDQLLIRADFPAILKSAEDLNQQVNEYCRLQALLDEISPREQSVLDLVLNGVPNKQIAKQLQVSVRTVESRRAKIYRKCEVRTVTELVRCVDHAAHLKRRFPDCDRSLRTVPRPVSGVDETEQINS